MALAQQQAFKPSGFWHAFKDYDGEPINVTEHQDAQEFLTRLQVCMRLPAQAQLTVGHLRCISQQSALSPPGKWSGPTGSQFQDALSMPHTISSTPVILHVQVHLQAAQGCTA